MANKTKFKVDIHKSGSISDLILKAIASHNEGKAVFTIMDLISFATVYRAIYALSYTDMYMERDEVDENKARLTEDNGKSWILTIEEIETFELKEETQEEIEERLTEKIDNLLKTHGSK